jgi:hypothetical protein
MYKLNKYSLSTNCVLLLKSLSHILSWPQTTFQVAGCSSPVVHEMAESTYRLSLVSDTERHGGLAIHKTWFTSISYKDCKQNNSPFFIMKLWSGQVKITASFLQRGNQSHWWSEICLKWCYQVFLPHSVFKDRS